MNFEIVLMSIRLVLSLKYGNRGVSVVKHNDFIGEIHEKSPQEVGSADRK